MRKQRNVKINPVCKKVRKTVADGPQYFVSGPAGNRNILRFVRLFALSRQKNTIKRPVCLYSRKAEKRSNFKRLGGF